MADLLNGVMSLILLLPDQDLSTSRANPREGGGAGVGAVYMVGTPHPLPHGQTDMTENITLTTSLVSKFDTHTKPTSSRTGLYALSSVICSGDGLHLIKARTSVI